MMCLDIPSVRTGHSRTKSDINTGLLAPVGAGGGGGLPEMGRESIVCGEFKNNNKTS